jgi:protein-S-isoprenylcysteine O-methyltransferase Ste14
VPDLGKRGEGWVVLQSIAFAGIVGCSFAGLDWPAAVEPWLPIAGVVLATAGLVLFVSGVAALGPAMTTLPKPRERGRLQEGRIYRLVRNPVYGGLILLTLGWSFAKAPLALVPTLALVAIFELKSRREEEWLTARYPEYAAYRDRTPRRFVPWLY